MDEYRILDQVATGSFGVIFRIERKSDGQRMAMKRIPLENLSAEERQRAMEEIAVMEGLHHPHIVMYRDAFLFNDTNLCIVMDFYDGGDLDAALRQQRVFRRLSEVSSRPQSTVEERRGTGDASGDPNTSALSGVKALFGEDSPPRPARSPTDAENALLSNSLPSLASSSTFGMLFTEQQVMLWFVQMCLAVHYLHAHRIIHRDLKTRNVFIDAATGAVAIGDFGVAQAMDVAATTVRSTINAKQIAEQSGVFIGAHKKNKSDTHLLDNSSRSSSSNEEMLLRDPTISDAKEQLHVMMEGTPLYMAPEVLEHSFISEKGDVWALGCILYELVALRHPFESRDLATLVANITRRPHDPPVKLPSLQYSGGITELINILLEKDPLKRPTMRQTLMLPFVRGYLSLFAATHVQPVPAQDEAEQSLVAQLHRLHAFPTHLSTVHPQISHHEEQGLNAHSPLHGSGHARVFETQHDSPKKEKQHSNGRSKSSNNSSSASCKTDEDKNRSGKGDQCNSLEALGSVRESGVPSIFSTAPTPTIARKGGGDSHVGSKRTSCSSRSSASTTALSVGERFVQPSTWRATLNEMEGKSLADLHEEVLRYRALIQEELREQLLRRMEFDRTHSTPSPGRSSRAGGSPRESNSSTCSSFSLSLHSEHHLYHQHQQQQQQLQKVSPLIKHQLPTIATPHSQSTPHSSHTTVTTPLSGIAGAADVKSQKRSSGASSSSTSAAQTRTTFPPPLLQFGVHESMERTRKSTDSRDTKLPSAAVAQPRKAAIGRTGEEGGGGDGHDDDDQNGGGDFPVSPPKLKNSHMSCTNTQTESDFDKNGSCTAAYDGNFTPSGRRQKYPKGSFSRSTQTMRSSSRHSRGRSTATSLVSSQGSQHTASTTANSPQWASIKMQTSPRHNRTNSPSQRSHDSSRLLPAVSRVNQTVDQQSMRSSEYTETTLRTVPQMNMKEYRGGDGVAGRDVSTPRKARGVQDSLMENDAADPRGSERHRARPTSEKSTPIMNSPREPSENSMASHIKMLERREALHARAIAVLGADVFESVYDYYKKVPVVQRDPDVVIHLAPHRSAWSALPDVERVLRLDERLALGLSTVVKRVM